MGNDKFIITCLSVVSRLDWLDIEQGILYLEIKSNKALSNSNFVILALKTNIQNIYQSFCKLMDF